jgi:hypothetical protein
MFSTANITTTYRHRHQSQSMATTQYGMNQAIGSLSGRFHFLGMDPTSDLILFDTLHMSVTNTIKARLIGDGESWRRGDGPMSLVDVKGI